MRNDDQGGTPGDAGSRWKAPLLAAMRALFGGDARRIRHAESVLAHAEALRSVEGGDADIVTAAAILHDIGIHAAERKHGSPAGHFQELEGPPIAKKIMSTLDIPSETADSVARIVGSHHSAKDIDTLEFRILWDADWLVNLPEEFPDEDAETRRRRIGRIFKTVAGRARASALFGLA